MLKLEKNVHDFDLFSSAGKLQVLEPHLPENSFTASVLF